MSSTTGDYIQVRSEGGRWKAELCRDGAPVPGVWEKAKRQEAAVAKLRARDRAYSQLPLR